MAPLHPCKSPPLASLALQTKRVLSGELILCNDLELEFASQEDTSRMEDWRYQTTLLGGRLTYRPRVLG